LSATPGFGFSSRIWSRKRLGVQIDLSRSRLSNDLQTDRVRSTEFVPSVIYSMPTNVSERCWVRARGGGAGSVPGVPRVAGGADFGYQWAKTVFEGFNPEGPRFSVSGHWYVK